MSFQKLPKNPSPVDPARWAEVRSQHGALCYRLRRGKTQILLVTSRRTRRWIVPKGWPVPDATPAETAAIEAYEEAGVRGEIHARCIGLYTYDKAYDEGRHVPCVVSLYPLRVTSLLGKFPERSERRRKWLSRKRAAAMVGERDLREIILGFDPGDIGN